MRKSPRTAAPSAAVDAVPSPAATSAPIQDEQRWFSLRGGARAKQFAANLEVNAKRVKRFLHGAK